jgi:hypothetical protein
MLRILEGIEGYGLYEMKTANLAGDVDFHEPSSGARFLPRRVEDLQQTAPLAAFEHVQHKSECHETPARD